MITILGEYRPWWGRRAAQDMGAPRGGWPKPMRPTCQTRPQPSTKEKKGFSKNKTAVANTATTQGPCEAPGGVAWACREKKYAPTGSSAAHRMTESTRYQRTVF